MTAIDPYTLRRHLLLWYQQHGRHTLPWQKKPTPYRVWVSEIMLQQTQVTTVIPYYLRFMRAFSTIKALALAPMDLVLEYWAGLGYYARARHLHQTAQIIHTKHRGRFPQTVTELSALPGIGRSTAGAILSFSRNVNATILDANVKRVLTRLYAIEEDVKKTATQKQLWQLAEALTSADQPAQYNQAIMDLGATLCTSKNPKCQECPLQNCCQAAQHHEPTAFPVTSARPKKPSKSTIALIIKDQSGGILLQKRPDSGIWGGLWCLPEIAQIEDMNEWLKAQYPISVHSTKILAQIKHSFTHYHLVITPVVLTIKKHMISKEMASSWQLWYNSRTRFHGGIPAPIAQLIHQFIQKRRYT